MIFLNFKTYESGTALAAVNMAKVAKSVAQETGIKIISVVQPNDIREVCEQVAATVWSQKIDGVSFGAHTGSIIPEAVKNDGAVGTFLNHSENRLIDLEHIAIAVKRAREVGLSVLVFAKDEYELEKVSTLKPDYISYEPPELIGNKEMSVVNAKPDIVSKAVNISKIHNIPLIIGAGVQSKEDVKRSLELGVSGIAVSSGVMLASDPRAKLMELAEGFK